MNKRTEGRREIVVCWLVYLRDGFAKTILRAATLRYKLQIQFSTSPSHSIQTPGQPVPALTLYRQAPGRVATGVPIDKSLVRLDPEKSHRKRDSNPGSSVPEADALNTRPTRQRGRENAASKADIRYNNICRMRKCLYLCIYTVFLSFNHFLQTASLA